MLKVLEKFETHGSFTYKSTDSLNDKCNAPTDKAGVYLVYDNDTNELIYIGRSGRINPDNTLFVRQGGIKNRIVAGKQFGEPRRRSWAIKMQLENINELRIDWYVTYDLKNQYCPESIEGGLLKLYRNINNNRPRWNRTG